MSEENEKGFLTAKEKRDFKIAGIILACLVVGYISFRIWPAPQFFGYRSFWRAPTNVAAEKPVTPAAKSGATLDSIADDLSTLDVDQRIAHDGIIDKIDKESKDVRYQINNLEARLGGFPWLYVTGVGVNGVALSPSPLGKPFAVFQTDKVAFVSFAEKAGGVARRLMEEDANDNNLLLSVVAWGREQAAEGDGYVVGLILADVGPPTTSLSYQVKVNNKTLIVNTTVGERCQRLVSELLAKEKKEKKMAESAEDSAE